MGSWTHETFGPELSVPSPNSLYPDIFRSVKSRNSKFGTTITHMLKWIQARLSRTQVVCSLSVRFRTVFVITISTKRFNLNTWNLLQFFTQESTSIYEIFDVNRFFRFWVRKIRKKTIIGGLQNVLTSMGVHILFPISCTFWHKYLHRTPRTPMPFSETSLRHFRQNVVRHSCRKLCNQRSDENHIAFDADRFRVHPFLVDVPIARINDRQYPEIKK